MTLKSAFFYLFVMCGKTGINCFVLITSYFMCRSNITLRKFLNLFLQIEFYNIVIKLIFIFTGYKNFNIKSLYEMFWPIKSVADGFTSCFLLFYLCIHFLIFLFTIWINDNKNICCNELCYMFLYLILHFILYPYLWNKL